MKRLMLIEDQPNDARAAADVAQSLGIQSVEACNTVYGALVSLEKGLAGESPLPDAIVLDLDLGMESGYELLRYWHGSPELHKIPVIVWSVIEKQREICQLFKVNSFVAKWEGMDAFRNILGQLVSASPDPRSPGLDSASPGTV